MVVPPLRWFEDDPNPTPFLKALETSKDFADIQVQGEHHPKTGNEIFLDLTAWYVTI